MKEDNRCALNRYHRETGGRDKGFEYRLTARQHGNIYFRCLWTQGSTLILWVGSRGSLRNSGYLPYFQDICLPSTDRSLVSAVVQALVEEKTVRIS